MNGTPTFFIGHQVAPGVPDFDEFSRLIDQELAAQAVGLSSAPPGARGPGRTRRLSAGRKKPVRPIYHGFPESRARARHFRTRPIAVRLTRISPGRRAVKFPGWRGNMQRSGSRKEATYPD